MTKTVAITDDVLAHCPVKAERAADLNREETADLMAWCDCQSEHLWEGMSLQEILNVYRASGEYVTWEAWASDDWKAAYKAWDGAVINPENKMEPR